MQSLMSLMRSFDHGSRERRQEALEGSKERERPMVLNQKNRDEEQTIAMIVTISILAVAITLIVVTTTIARPLAASAASLAMNPVPVRERPNGRPNTFEKTETQM